MRPLVSDSPTASHYNNFDFLRFLLATSVLFYHTLSLLYGSSHGGLAATMASVGAGNAVNFFFAISGFLITDSWMRTQKLFRFLQKRILRIYPAFILASIFCAFVAGPLGAENVHEYWQHFHPLRFLMYLPLLPADVVGPDMSLVFTQLHFPALIDGSFWTLRYEFEFYLLVALFGLLGLFRRPVLILGLFALLFILPISFVPNHEFPWVGNPARWLRLSVYFLSGMVFYLYRTRIPYSPVAYAIGLAVICAGVWILWLNILTPILGVYALLCVAFDPRIKLQRFARYGDFSYGIYVFAFPIQQVLIQHFGSHLTAFSLFAYAFSLTLLFAVASWYGVEKPFLQLKPRQAGKMMMPAERRG